MGSTIEFLGPPVALGTVAVGTAVLISDAYDSYRYTPTAPGNYQATQLVQGSGYNTDPEFSPTPPKTPWKALAWNTIVSTVGIMAFEQFCEGWCMELAQGPKMFTGNGPVVNLPNMPIGSYGSAGSSGISSPTAHTACGLLCLVPQNSQSSGAGSNQGQSNGGSGGSGGYGAAGTVYTQFVPANTHSACGKLCM